MHPTQGVETFSNISEPSFDRCAKFYVNPAGRGVKCKRVSKIKRCFTCRRLCLVPMSRSSLSSPDKFPNKSIIIPCILHKTDSHSALLKQTRKFLVKWRECEILQLWPWWQARFSVVGVLGVNKPKVFNPYAQILTSGHQMQLGSCCSALWIYVIVANSVNSLDLFCIWKHSVST